MTLTIRIATRKSPLALWQANFIKTQIQTRYPEVNVELLGILTTADKMFATPLNAIGGKGLFVKELEQAILEHRADMAVHSIKDMPAELPEGLELTVVCKREDPRDAFVANGFKTLVDLPPHAIVGTSSLRRKAQVLAIRPDLNIEPLRGNVGTRLQKLDNGEYEAIILAAAGLTRLGSAARINSYFSFNEMLPAAGQGAIGIECRQEDTTLKKYVAFLNDADTAYAVLAERTLNQKLGGSCQFPIAAYAVVNNQVLSLKAMVGDPNGSCILKTSQEATTAQAEALGYKAAQDLIDQGAEALLAKIPKESGR
ncbi:MAG: hydroxymethylbilane synthase [Gammaproteobacteria bacterium]|nr:hydroxymethylbilane synthase [Gammaproteobacteria bacterium]